MLLKIIDFPDQLADDLKSVTGQATASKAVLHAASKYSALLTDFNFQSLDVEKLEQEVVRLRTIIEGARSAAALLLDHTAQEDLF